MLTLYAVPQSPYCAKVRGALRLKEIPYLEQEPPGGSYQTTEYQEMVAAGSVPAIQQGRWILHDSQAILEYLNEQYPGPSLWDADPRCRATQRAILNYHDSKLEPAVRDLVPLVGADDALGVGLARDRLYDRLYRLERILSDAGFAENETRCPVDWTIPCTLAIGADLLGVLGQPLELPGKLSEWLRVVIAHPIAQAERERVRAAIAVWLNLRAVATGESMPRRAIN